MKNLLKFVWVLGLLGSMVFAENISYEEFKDKAVKIGSDRYIVDGDIAIYGEANLHIYYNNAIVEKNRENNVTTELIINTIFGHDDSWSSPTKNNLTYCVDIASFSDQEHQQVVSSMNVAQNDWEKNVNINFIYKSSEDADCDNNNYEVIFNVRKATQKEIADGSDTLAFAFFPKRVLQRSKRELVIFPNAFTSTTFNLNWVLTHELGHTLGFRHEHIRVDSSCSEADDWREITDYDITSIMHYPQCDGDFVRGLASGVKISDRAGAQLIYGNDNISASDGTSRYHVTIGNYSVFGVDNYKVYRTSSIHGEKKLLPRDANSWGYYDRSAIPGHKYYYFIQACNNHGCSQLSAPDRGFKIAVTPPYSISASDGRYPDRVVIGSYEVSGVYNTYKIYRTESAGTNPTEDHIIGETGSNGYSDYSAESGKFYYYYVQTCNSQGCSKLSGVDKGYRSTVPAPLGIHASDGSSPYGVIVKNYKVSGAVKYKLYRSSARDSKKYLATSSTNQNIMIDRGARPEQKYYYFVKACKSNGDCSLYSQPDTGYKKKLTAPSNIYASDNRSPFILVQNYTVSGATKYKIYRTSSPSTNVTESMKIKETTHRYITDRTALYGHTYYYYVKACYGNVCSGYSGYDTGYRKPVLSAPTSISASDGRYSNKVVVGSYATTGASYYKIYRASSSVGKPVFQANTTSSSYTDTHALLGYTYYYYVEACNSKGCSIKSEPDVGYLENADGVTLLQESTTIHGKHVGYRKMKYYKIRAKGVNALLYNLGADIDIYIKIGSKPTVTSSFRYGDFDYYSYKSGRQDDYISTSTSEQERDIYIGVRGYDAGNYDLRVTKKY